MPFAGQAYPFQRPFIEMVPMGREGVYGLYNSTTWVYIGRGIVRDRLLAHLNGDNECINRNRPTHFVYELTLDSERRERELIAEYNPVCNRRVG